MVHARYNKIFAAVYHNEEGARRGIQALREAGFDTEQISLITNREEVRESLKQKENVDAESAPGAGMAGGAAIGALGGLVIGTASLLLPGIGALIVAGPFASALGLIGGATATGAATGAIGGGLLGLLTKAGVNQNDAQEYSKEIERGNLLILIPTTTEDADLVKTILADTGADHVRASQIEESESAWDWAARA